MVANRKSVRLGTLAVVCLTAVAVRAQDAPLEVMTEVLPKSPDFVFKDGAKVVPLESKVNAFYVERVEGDRVRIYRDGREEDLDMILTKPPGNARARSLRGGILLRKGEPVLALADFNEAILLNPKDHESWYRRGLIWKAQEEYEKALSDFDAAIRIDPEDAANASAYRELALLRANCPDTKFRNSALSLESASKACQTTAWKDHDCLITLAEVHAYSGDFGSAIEAVDKAIALLDAGDKKIETCRAMQASYRQRKDSR